MGTVCTGLWVLGHECGHGAFGRNKKAYSYLAESIRAFPNQKSVREDLSNHGFSPSTYHLLNFGITTLFEAFKPIETQHNESTEI